MLFLKTNCLSKGSSEAVLIREDVESGGSGDSKVSVMVLVMGLVAMPVSMPVRIGIRIRVRI